MQADIRVRRRQAKPNPISYPTYSRCKIDSENKRSVNPWAIEKSFTQEVGSKTVTLRSNNEFDFVIEI